MHPAIGQVYPKGYQHDRQQGHCHLPCVQAQHQRQPAEQFGDEYRVGEHTGEAQPREERRGTRQAEHQPFQQGVGDPHQAETNAQQGYAIQV